MLTIDLSENKVLGPAYQRGLQEGRQGAKSACFVGENRIQVWRSPFLGGATIGPIFQRDA